MQIKYLVYTFLFEGTILETGMSKYLEENTQQRQLNVSMYYHLALLRNRKIQVDRIQHEKCYFRSFVAPLGTINLVFDVSIFDQCNE